jgi:putative sporulation protein YyaC
MTLVPEDKPVLFACIGTDRSTGDALGPLVGTFLEEKGYEVIGTLANPLHALVIEVTAVRIKEDYPNHFVIAIDACLGRTEAIGNVIVEEGAIFPGKAVGKELTAIGDVAIKGIVNVGGYMEYSVLQNTRLHGVWEMGKEITRMCDDMMKSRKPENEVRIS